MNGIRQKLMYGFVGVLLVITLVGILTTAQLRYLGHAIDTILRENYRSVEACQNMIETIERTDSGLLFMFSDNDELGRKLVEQNMMLFEAALQREKGNVTLLGEREVVDRLNDQYNEYHGQVQRYLSLSTDSERQKLYFRLILPRFYEIKKEIVAIRDMNQHNMNEANDNARRIAATAMNRQIFAIVLCALVTFFFYWLIRRWIVNPIRRLNDTANDIRQGNYDVALNVESKDEIGQLSRTFNAMSESLRQIRKSEKQGLMRTRKATEEALKVLPAAVIVTDRSGKVEVADETADKVMAIKVGMNLHDLDLKWLDDLFERALRENRQVESDGDLKQMFGDNREYFFQPIAMPVPAGAEEAEVTGVMVILKDMTQVQEQQELKRSVVSTVSHQLKTPLTSLRMSLHLLLDWRTGPLNPQQTELLTAARDESERLVQIVEDLLNLSRLESGNAPLNRTDVTPTTLIDEIVEHYHASARDLNIQLENRSLPGLPEISADAVRIKYVLGNLISNAFRYTSPGGTVAVKAVDEGDFIRFTVADTGKGIPDHYQPYIFDPFFRVPGQDNATGVGLGLTIAREIVQAHGGRIGLESEPGKGTVVWFTLPKPIIA